MRSPVRSLMLGPGIIAWACVFYGLIFTGYLAGAVTFYVFSAMIAFISLKRKKNRGRKNSSKNKAIRNYLGSIGRKPNP